MRHVYVRGVLALLWLAAAVVSGVSGRLETAAFYVILAGVFLYSAYRVWDRERGHKGGR